MKTMDGVGERMDKLEDKTLDGQKRQWQDWKQECSFLLPSIGTRDSSTDGERVRGKR